MSAEVYYRFFQNTRLLGEGEVQAPFTVGRQTDLRLPPPVSVLHIPQNSKDYLENDCLTRKLVIVPLGNRVVPRLSLRIEIDDSGNLRARNLHRAVELHLLSHEWLRPQDELNLGPDGTICFPEDFQLRLTAQQSPALVPQPIRGTVLAIEGTADSETSPEVEENSPVNDGKRSFFALEPVLDDADNSSTRLLTLMAQRESVNHQELAVRFVRTALEAFKEPPGSKEFFDAAGRAAIQMIDLDRVAVLLKDGNQWVCRTLTFRPGLDQSRAAARDFSQTLLQQMEINGRTTCVAPQLDSQDLWTSIREVDRAVAAPIFNEHKAVVGALYGDRLMGENENHQPIGELEAALLEVIASGISSSLAIKQEQRLRSSMAQFFSPVILEQLKRDPALLDGRETEVSVLFCDIRGFSSVTERIGPTQAVAWINDVLTTLSQCVLAYDGVLLDYIGDELMAMWGAPAEQPDHAYRACRAAIDMLAHVGPLCEKWKSVVPQGFELGIGINSGPASVGNTGSKQRFKYSPIGNSVNLASRVQGISKQVGIPGLITGHTAALLASSSEFHLRRLAKVRVVGIAQPIDLFELNASPNNQDLFVRYEQALRAHEAGDLKRAAGGQASLVQDYPDDRPTIILLGRAVELLTQPDREFDPVWNLSIK